MIAQPPPPPPPHRTGAGTAAGDRDRAYQTGTVATSTSPARAVRGRRTGAAACRSNSAAAAPAFAVLPAAAAEAWWVGAMPEPADQVVRIEALAGLMDAHSDRVIPLLKEIALDRNSPDEGRRAVVILAHSPRPEAHSIVLEVARGGAEPVQLAAIRELGRLQDANVSNTLLQVYAASGAPRVRRQVVTSLGERADVTNLLRIARTEQDTGVRNAAIQILGPIGAAREQLRTLYGLTPMESREAVMNALFTAKDDDELIRIASSEQNPILRQRARQLLRLLATPRPSNLTDNR